MQLTQNPELRTPEEPAPLVFLHGWGSDSRVWQELLPYFKDFQVQCIDLPGFGHGRTEKATGLYSLDALLEWLAARLPQRATLVGWSLGGMLATAFAARYPQRVASLVTVATNLSFIRRRGWPMAMALDTFKAFQGFFQQDSSNCLKRFCALQAQGDRHERGLLRQLRQLQPQAIDPSWQMALTLLGDIDNRHAFQQLSLPGLHLFGAEDALVPVAATREIAELNNRQQIKVLPDISHAPQLSHPEKLAEPIRRFLNGHNPYSLDKRQIAAAFSRAAATYDSVAHLQRRVGEELFERIGLDAGGRRANATKSGVSAFAETAGDTRISTIIDIGCGTGLFTERLQQAFPDSAVIGLDLAPGMVDYAREHRDRRINWLCGDAEDLPLASSSADLVYANFSFQWCQDLPGLMAEITRVLASGGRLVFSTLGPESLRELRAAWQQVDGHIHVNHFAPQQELEQVIRAAGLGITESSNSHQTCYYPELADLQWELKCLGARNLNLGRPGGLTGRKQVAALKQAYETCRTVEGLPATWDIICIMGGKP